MNHVLLSIHVLAGIVFVGGSAVASSLFPRYAPVASTTPITTTGSATAVGSTKAAGAERSAAVAAALHRITGGYAAFGLIVPLAGIVLASVQGRMGQTWIIAAMILTAVAGALLATQIHPRQRQALDVPDDGRRLRTLTMLTGVYNLLWAAVVVLMIVRPGEQTGA
ncbi:hypothetical protein ACIBQ6_11325 [Nonomuraea sp. NPDC049655]|uniref:hypothetical protein n=1 Tax=Nonomuraea sp. NPDC049655 TaxID=3364355 RepID=UPI0037878E9C